ncbi:Fic family protein [Rosenbergiella epipactidis]|uniref:Fic family protein n=1 Tax=Rosenbergiella epipactidis TaxID=1544694 RepID=UPI001F4E4861|nr:Fic family protein [Rosenbergiella epipactidis]
MLPTKKLAFTNSPFYPSINSYISKNIKKEKIEMRVIRPTTQIMALGDAIAEIAKSHGLNINYFNINRDGDYQSYYEIKHKHPKDHIAIWNYVSAVRKHTAQTLPFSDMQGNSCRFNHTPLMGSVISQVDRKVTHAGVMETLTSMIGHSFILDDLENIESISSSQLEGAVTTTKVALEMLQTKRTPRDDSERMIARNHDLMQKLPDTLGQELSPSFILSLHNIATKGINDSEYYPGQLRTRDDIVVADSVTGEIIHQPIAHTELYDKLSELCEWANTPHHTMNGPDYIHPLVKACILHFMIGWLHPFTDGNGRTARGLFYWYMLKMGYTGFKYISISKYMKRSATSYAAAYLNSEYDQFNITYFIDYHLKQVQHAIAGFLDKLQEQSKTIEYLHDQFRGNPIFSDLNHRQRKIAAFGMIRSGEQFSISSIATRFNIAYNTAKNDLEMLCKAKIFKNANESDQAMYLTPKSVSQLEQWLQDNPDNPPPKATNW